MDAVTVMAFAATFAVGTWIGWRFGRASADIDRELGDDPEN